MSGVAPCLCQNGVSVDVGIGCRVSFFATGNLGAQVDLVALDGPCQTPGGLKLPGAAERSFAQGSKGTSLRLRRKLAFDGERSLRLLISGTRWRGSCSRAPSCARSGALACSRERQATTSWSSPSSRLSSLA